MTPADIDVARLREEIREAGEYLHEFLCTYVHRYCDPVPDWKPLPDLIGMLTQIDNATTVAEKFRDRALATEQRAGEAEAVISFYGNPYNWSVDGSFVAHRPGDEYRPDCGARARAFIEGVGK